MALGAQYDVVRLLGKGGMGAVYLGRERLLERQVAIKVLPHESADTDDARDRFLREARTAARLTHPNIVPLYSFGEAGNTLFYIMGYVEGESLEQRLRREQRLSYDDTRRILGELASALDHAHAQGIVHRDIKPDNVMLEVGTGRPVLTDFGIAKHQVGGHTLTRTGMIVGTPHYMSPEQATGERELDGRSDIYALGIMAYRMLSGRLPFSGASLQELIAQQVSRDPVPLSAIVPEIPPDLDAAIGRCLAKDPAQRWSSAALLRDALGSGDLATALPDTLENIPGSGASTVMMGYVMTLVGTTGYAFTGRNSWLSVLPWILAGTVAGIVGPVWRGKRHGFSPRRVLRIAFWPPKFWELWWPRALRRPGDVWDRLPGDVRRVRAIVSACVIAGAGVFLPALVHLVPSLRDGDLLAGVITVVTAGLLPMLAALVATFAYTIKWRKKYGLSMRDAEKLRSESTWNSKFWKRPDIARLLTGQLRASLAEGTPESPLEIVAALERMMPLVAEPVRPLITEGLAAARQAAQAVAAIDEELRLLARDADPAERGRLEERLRGLDSSRSDAPASSRQMRDLVSGQLALMDELARRAEELAARRTRYLELLRTLWLQLSALRAGQAGDALAASEVSGRIRDICHDVSLAVHGEREAARVLESQLDTPTTPLRR